MSDAPGLQSHAAPRRLSIALMLQLNPPIPVDTPRGQALAHGWIDYGPEYSILWICIGDDGQCWCWPNDKIRGVKNMTMGRDNPENMMPKCDWHEAWFMK